MLSNLKNKILYYNKYKPHPEAIVISCFFNPQNSPYRLRAFDKFYGTIKHLNHKIVECVIGNTIPQLLTNPNIERVYTKNLLWHKEALLNKIVSELPAKYKYIFWVDADVIFTNNDWLIQGVEVLKSYSKIIQPFEYCVHLDKDETEPSFNPSSHKETIGNPLTRHPKMWRSFAANHSTLGPEVSGDSNYDKHGHVGFAWGARREVLDAVPLYDKALIGGADHVIAHSAVGQIPHSCITKSFTENIDEITEWSKKFHAVVDDRIGYVKGNLYHIWHGDIEKRQYLKRIQDFTPKTKQIINKDDNGLYVTGAEDDEYILNYYRQREVGNGFMDSLMLGYIFDSPLVGNNLAGSIIGAELRDNDDKQEYPDDWDGNLVAAPATPDAYLTPADSTQSLKIDSDNFS